MELQRNLRYTIGEYIEEFCKGDKEFFTDKIEMSLKDVDLLLKNGEISVENFEKVCKLLNPSKEVKDFWVMFYCPMYKG